MAKTSKKASPKKAATKKVSPKKAGDKKPRKPSSFIIFSKENRDKVMKDNNLKKSDIGDIGKALGALWRNMSDAQKKVYADKAAK